MGKLDNCYYVVSCNDEIDLEEQLNYYVLNGYDLYKIFTDESLCSYTVIFIRRELCH